jgi:hypothetical protein
MQPTAQLRREIPRIIPTGVRGRTSTTKRKRIQLRSLLLLLIIIILLLLLLSRILMVLLRRKLVSPKPSLVPIINVRV